MSDYTFRCNGDRILIDGARLHEGDVRYVPGTGGEQCESCGSEVIEGASVNRARTQLTCGNCGYSYALQPMRVRE